jgi:hypothetical protein
VQSYEHSLDFGLMADGAAMPDVRELAEAVAIAFDDLRLLPQPGEPGHADTPDAATVARAAGRAVTQAARQAATKAVRGAAGGIGRTVGGLVKGAVGSVVGAAVAGSVKKATAPRRPGKPDPRARGRA